MMKPSPSRASPGRGFVPLEESRAGRECWSGKEQWGQGWGKWL